MKHETLSFGLALAVVLGIFFAVQSLKGFEGQAFAASSTGLAGKTIAEDARYSSAQKRSIRRKIMSRADGIKDVNRP